MHWCRVSSLKVVHIVWLLIILNKTCHSRLQRMGNSHSKNSDSYSSEIVEKSSSPHEDSDMFPWDYNYHEMDDVSSQFEPDESEISDVISIQSTELYIRPILSSATTDSSPITTYSPSPNSSSSLYTSEEITIAPSSNLSSISTMPPPTITTTTTTTTTQTSASTPIPVHAGEHLQWLLRQERLRHPWRRPDFAPHAIQEAWQAYDHMNYGKFCEEAKIKDEVPLLVTDGSFHPKFEVVPGVGVYRFHATPLSWEDARAACEDEGAQIAIVNSFPEAKALAEIHNRCPFILDTHFNDYQFLGAHDLYGEGNWETTSGDNLHETGYLRWGVGQPDNAHHYGEDCLAINRYGFFNDVPCWIKLPFTCEHA